MKKTTKNWLIVISLISIIMTSSCSKDKDEVDVPPTQQITQNDIAEVDKVVKDYMDKYKIPGLSLAVTKNEKLVYVKGYGKADKEKNLDVTPNSIFRIASISKTITGIAITKLIEEGKLNMDNKVFGATGILGTTYGKKAYSTKLTSLTVRNLLQHTSGGWPTDGTDPAFKSPELSSKDLIDWTLDNTTLPNVPGEVYQYSNFGYILLGVIIEKVSNKTYENYVKEAIFKPIGIESASVAGNTLEEQKTNEVKYYGTTAGGSSPYIYNLRRLASAGGWTISAKDLVKLIAHVDGFEGRKDLLNPNSIKLFTTIASLSKPSYYANGILIQSNDWWHNGSLPGTLSHFSRNNNRITAVAIVNQRNGGNDSNDLNLLTSQSIAGNNSIKWQDIDQF